MPLASKILWLIASVGTSLFLGVYLLEIGGLLQMIRGALSGDILRIVIGYVRFNASFLVQLNATLWLYYAWPELCQRIEKRLSLPAIKRP